MSRDDSPTTEALSSAVHFLRRGVRPDGTPEDGSDWEIASHQWGLFISWAYNRGVSLPASLAPDRDGGPEHDLLFDAANARWLRFSKPYAAGFVWEFSNGENYFVRRPAAPLQYLQRWRLLNWLFGADVRLVGLSCLGRTQRIVTSHPHHPGEPPTWEELGGALEKHHGFRQIPPGEAPESQAYQRGRLILFDVCPAESVRRADGRILPVGANPQIFPSLPPSSVSCVSLC